MVNRFIDFFESLTLKRKMLFLIFTALILMLLTILMANSLNRNKTYTYSSTLDYKNLDITTLLSKSFVENYDNRDDYVALENVIKKLLSKYNGEYSVYKEYYDAVDDNYKKYINKKKFAIKLNEIASKVNDTNNNYKINMYVNTFYNNTYILEIESEEKFGYIGFILDKTEKTYSIFYIE